MVGRLVIGAGVVVLPEPGVLLAAVVCAGLGAAVALLVVAVRGVVVDSARPPGRYSRAVTALGSPALTGRLVGGLLVATGTLLTTRWLVAAVGLGALVVAWPRLFGASRAEQARINRLEGLVGWTESLRDTIAAHASLEQAIPATTDGAPPVIRPALVRLTGQIKARAPMEGALLALAAELDDPSADLVVAALILNVRRRGDRLAEVLTGLAAAAREEVDLRRRVSAGRAGLRRGVQMVVALTVAFATFLIVFGGAYLRPYDSPAGQIALGVVIAMFAVGFAWMRQLSGADEARPFLARPGQVASAAELRVVTHLTGANPAAARDLGGDPSDGRATTPTGVPGNGRTTGPTRLGAW